MEQPFCISSSLLTLIINIIVILTTWCAVWLYLDYYFLVTWNLNIWLGIANDVCFSTRLHKHRKPDIQQVYEMYNVDNLSIVSKKCPSPNKFVTNCWVFLNKLQNVATKKAHQKAGVTSPHRMFAPCRFIHPNSTRQFPKLFLKIRAWN